MRRMSAPRLMRCAREKRRRALRGGVLGRKLHGQALPTLFATTTQHFTAPARRHARAKSVLPDSLLVAGAIGGLSHSYVCETKLIWRCFSGKETYPVYRK